MTYALTLDDVRSIVDALEERSVPDGYDREAVHVQADEVAWTLLHAIVDPVADTKEIAQFRREAVELARRFLQIPAPTNWGWYA